MAEAGWYDDPMVPGGKRYWDGARWTEHAQGPPVAAPANPGVAVPAPQTGPPPFDPTMAYQGAAGGPVLAQGAPVRPAPTGLNDVGDWLKRSFTVVGQNFVPLVLLLLPQLIIGAMAYLMLDQSLRNIIINNSGDIIGTDAGLLWAAGLLFGLTTLVGFVTSLGVHHNLYAGHVGQRSSTGASFFAGLRATPRYIGILLLLYLAMLVVIGALVAVGIGLGAALGEDAPGVILALAAAAYIGLFVLMIWLSVKLAFVTVGAVVIPRGASVIRTSWNVTRGWFWAIFGRQLLLGLLLAIFFMVLYFGFYLAALAVFFTTFGFNSDGELTVNGQALDDLDVFVVADFLPNPALVIAMFGLLYALAYLTQALSYSGTVALYADLGGPNTFGHSRTPGRGR